MSLANRVELQDYIERRSIQEPNSGCWIWMLSDGGHGYPQGSFPQATGQRVSLAHRMSYNAFNGDIPDGYEVDHLCRNRSCVNPNHLEAVTKHANRARQMGKKVDADHSASDGCSTCGTEYRVVSGNLQCPKCRKDALRRYNLRKRAPL